MPSESHPRTRHPTQLPVGAFPLPDGSSLFRVWAPRARRVDVELLRSDAAPGSDLEHLRCRKRERMQPLGFGLFEARIAAPAGSDYAFRLDGKRRRADPASRWQPFGVHGPSRSFDPSSLTWNDQAWVPPRRDTLVIYQVHVGTYSPAATFAGIVADLPRLAELGIGALQLLPIAEFPGTRNWGYDGVFPYAVESSYGGPFGLAALVDACHDHGIAVYLDLVFNHLGPEGDYTADFGPYSNSRFHTPWGNALNFDEAGSACVRQFFYENALYWRREFHIDGFRFDAIAQVFDSSPTHILREINDSLPDAAKHLSIAESELNSNHVLSSDRAGLGFDAQWNDDFHHALIARLTGNQRAFLADFQGDEPLLKVLEEGWALASDWSQFRGRFHGEPCGARPDQLVVFSQNHDQVAGIGGGRRAGGAQGAPEQELLLVMTLMSGFVPMLFQGQDFGASTGFHYFIDHRDPALKRRVVAGRRHEQKQLSPGAPYLSPASISAWSQSRLDWDQLGTGWGQLMQTKVRQLTELRRRHACFRANAKRQVQARWEGSLLILSMLQGASRGVLVAHLPQVKRLESSKNRDLARARRALNRSTLQQWLSSLRAHASTDSTCVEERSNGGAFRVAYRTERVRERTRDFVFDGPSALVLVGTRRAN